MLFLISFFQWVLMVQSLEPFDYDVNFAGAIGDGESDDTEVYFLLKCYRPSRMHDMLSVLLMSLQGYFVFLMDKSFCYNP
ncbi:hypothetical protein Gogos_012809 [Gossypium gossypioides]|uniref:Uncharacterized protein n=1 Tax=Gossypium gossypioides TaxID=34282 RepID=A0A7J9BTS4_GOSGO|nr:hypothetical protein [Gossypium gossypioides]